MDKSIFITRFKQLCKLNKKTQAEIAETLGISVNGLKHYMRKTNNSFPPIEYLDLMAKEFNVDIAYLIGEINVPKHNMLTLYNKTGLHSRDGDIQMNNENREFSDFFVTNKVNCCYPEKTYAIDLISTESKEFSPDFCYFIDFLANSDKISELSRMFFSLFYSLPETDVIILGDKSSVLDHAYNSSTAKQRALRSQIVSLFDQIIEDEINRKKIPCVDFDLSKTMVYQLVEFIEKKYFDIPREKMLKIIKRRLEEIKDINEYDPILEYTPPKILSGSLFTIANDYKYDLSPEFKKRYLKELKSIPIVRSYE